jgi:RNA polymerase sigma-70 factor (ECF subfamily)
VRHEDTELVSALSRGDERTFAALVEAWGGTMLRLACVYVASRAVAEEVVQEAWLVVLRSLDRFERRSSLRTWVLGIVVNLARAHARAERRSAQLPPDEEPAVDPARFRPPSDRWAGHWATPPAPWPLPEDEILASELRDVLLRAIESLPPAQRAVLVLRDLEGFGAAETCDVLGLSETNQRVLLHRARSKVQTAIERY